MTGKQNVKKFIYVHITQYINMYMVIYKNHPQKGVDNQNGWYEKKRKVVMNKYEKYGCRMPKDLCV